MLSGTLGTGLGVWGPWWADLVPWWTRIWAKLQLSRTGRVAKARRVNYLVSKDPNSRKVTERSQTPYGPRLRGHLGAGDALMLVTLVADLLVTLVMPW